jgi:DNA end-binding protein Ku
MAPRPYWSGHIRLSLVTIAVDIVAATKPAAKIAFHQIHKPSGSRVRYQKVVPDIGPVDTDDIVKGYEVDKGRYVLIEDEEIDKLKLEAKKTIDLVQFVDLHEIDQMYFDRPFYVLPQEDSDPEAYIVLRDALRASKTVGLGQIVIRGKSAVVAIKACGDGITMETLRYGDEIKRASAVFKDNPDKKPEKELIELAESLIEKKKKKFDPKAFHDAYEDALHELIEAKQHHRKVKTIEEPEKTAKVVNLMDALRRSVKGGEGGPSHARRARGRGTAKRTARRGGRRKAA